MKRKILLAALLTFLVAALVGGGTMAWFTAKASVVNEFTAGTVMIKANETVHPPQEVVDNWNPGDCVEKKYCIENTGTKEAYIRGKLTPYWSPGDKRVLVVYIENNGGVEQQPLAFEWTPPEQICTGGLIAKGTIKVNITAPRTTYLNAVLSNVSDNDYDIFNGTYLTWCVDSEIFITLGAENNFQIFDPFCDPEWYIGVVDVNRYAHYEGITWGIIDYIINQGYVGQTFTCENTGDTFGPITIMDVQNAIWHFTNGVGTYECMFDGPDPCPTATNYIVCDADTNWLDPDNVTIEFEPCAEGSEWSLVQGYWYYQLPLPGTYSGAEEAARTACLCLKVCLSGPETGNNYQGKDFYIFASFEAIQSSNNASTEVWGWSPSP